MSLAATLVGALIIIAAVVLNVWLRGLEWRALDKYRARYVPEGHYRRYRRIGMPTVFAGLLIMGLYVASGITTAPWFFVLGLVVSGMGFVFLVHAWQRSASWVCTLTAIGCLVVGFPTLLIGAASLAGTPTAPLGAVAAWSCIAVGLTLLFTAAKVYSL